MRRLSSRLIPCALPRKRARSFLTAVEAETVPDVLSFNTRVQCATCSTPAQARHQCARCRSVVYCSEEHARRDAARHAFWCHHDAAL